MAFFWFGETLGTWDIIGGLVVLSGLLLAVQFGCNENSDCDRLNGQLWAVVLLGLVAVLCQGFGFLAVKPAMAEGMSPPRRFRGPASWCRLYHIRDRAVAHPGLQTQEPTDRSASWTDDPS